MSDARTEARRRIAAAIEDRYEADKWINQQAGDLADAVLEPFPDVWWQELVDANPAWGERLSRRLIVAGPWEPIMPVAPVVLEEDE